MPTHAVTLTVQVDADVADWFTAQGDDFEQRVSAALRMYAEAHKAARHSNQGPLSGGNVTVHPK